MDTSYDTKVLWYDAKLDVAVCQVKIDLPYVSMKDRVIYPTTNQNLRVLEQVIAIGTPLDFSLQNWCTTGTISKLDCYSTSDGNLYEMLIESKNNNKPQYNKSNRIRNHQTYCISYSYNIILSFIINM